MAVRSDEIMTIDDLAAYLKISKSTLYKLVQAGRLPGQKVGKRWRFHKAVVDEWLGNSASGTRPPPRVGGNHGGI